ncbi:MAG: hypothetical protein ACYTFW_00660 [Planctomycetota bacterium]|jgi:hypothetical protein
MSQDTVCTENVVLWKGDFEMNLKAILAKSPFFNTGGVNVFEHGAIYTSNSGGQTVVFGDTGENARYDFMDLDANKQVIERLGDNVINITFTHY